jgi:hypothetical protein
LLSNRVPFVQQCLSFRFFFHHLRCQCMSNEKFKHMHEHSAVGQIAPDIGDSNRRARRGFLSAPTQNVIQPKHPVALFQHRASLRAQAGLTEHSTHYKSKRYKKKKEKQKKKKKKKIINLLSTYFQACFQLKLASLVDVVVVAAAVDDAAAAATVVVVAG